MLIKEDDGRVNFIDKNDSFVGFSTYQDCCETFGWYVADHITECEPATSASLDGFWFDTDTQQLDVNGYFEEGGSVAFKCVNSCGDVRYLHLYNSHNGYYSHGWESSWGCEGHL